MGFSLRVETSAQAGRQAGNGLWLHGKANVGSVVALYPGLVYTSENYRQVPQSQLGPASAAVLYYRSDRNQDCASRQPWLSLSATIAGACSRDLKNYRTDKVDCIPLL